MSDDDHLSQSKEGKNCSAQTDLVTEKDQSSALQSSPSVERNHLTGQEIWNLTFCLLAWACTISTATVGKCADSGLFDSRNIARETRL